MNVLGKRTLNRTSRLLFAGLLLGSGLFSVCDRQPITKYAENKPPETTIFIGFRPAIESNPERA